MYQHHGVTESREKAGRGCFDKVYKEKWKDVLHIRGIEEHARCDQCAQLLKRARDDPDPQVRADARKAHDAHINLMIRDRIMDSRMTRLSELATALASHTVGCFMCGLMAWTRQSSKSRGS